MMDIWYAPLASVLDWPIAVMLVVFPGSANTTVAPGTAALVGKSWTWPATDGAVELVGADGDEPQAKAVSEETMTGQAAHRFARLPIRRVSRGPPVSAS